MSQQSITKRFILATTRRTLPALPTAALPGLRAANHKIANRGAILNCTFVGSHGTPPSALIQRRHKSGYFHKFHHLKMRTFWSQVQKEVKKRPKRLAFAVGLLLAIPLGGYGYWQYYQDIVPHSGRRRMMDVSREEEQRMGLASFHLLKQQYKDQILPENHELVLAVKRIGRRIIEQTDLQGLHWEFLVIQSDEMNAFVLPGGKVCVFTGILSVTQDEYGLATVLGHEVGHVVARHGAEKWSKMRWERALGWLTAILIAREEPGWLINQFLTLFLALPFSRKFEHEADFIGLMLMAEAGYDPTNAVDLWIRFSAASPSMLKYLSTHPPNADRIVLLKRWMPQALDQYHKHTRPQATAVIV